MPRPRTARQLLPRAGWHGCGREDGRCRPWPGGTCWFWWWWTSDWVVRILAQIAYRPALLYIDSTKYLLGAYPGDDPTGYQFAIKPVVALGSLDDVAALQHLLGLAMAVTLYVVLLRRRAPRWLAALATTPLRHDAYQVQL